MNSSHHDLLSALCAGSFMIVFGWWGFRAHDWLERSVRQRMMDKLSDKGIRVTKVQAMGNAIGTPIWSRVPPWSQVYRIHCLRGEGLLEEPMIVAYSLLTDRLDIFDA